MSYIGLADNEQADRAAKSTASTSLLMDDIGKKLDFQRYTGNKFEKKIMEANPQYYRQHNFSLNLLVAQIRLDHTIATNHTMDPKESSFSKLQLWKNSYNKAHSLLEKSHLEGLVVGAS